MGQPLGQDKGPSRLGFGGTGRKTGLWVDAAPLGDILLPWGRGSSPLLPSSAKGKGQKMGRKGADEGSEPGEREAERSKAQAMGSDNLNSCAEGLSLQAN